MDDERLAKSDECRGVDGPALEPRRVGVVLAAAGRQLEARAPAKSRRSEELEVAHPKATCREGSVEPLVAERHHRIGSKLVHVDRYLAERLRGIDDRDRTGLARKLTRVADRQHVARLAGHERDHDGASASTHAGPHLGEEALPVAVPPDLEQLVTELGAPPHRVESAPMLLAGCDD